LCTGPHLGGGTGYNCPGRQYVGGAKIFWSEICSFVKNFNHLAALF
jgi:hypothetical protein